MVQSALRVNISVLQIERLQLGVAVGNTFSHIAAHQRILRHPIQAVGKLHRVPSQRIQHLPPQGKDLPGRLIHAGGVALFMSQRSLQVSALHLQGCGGCSTTGIPRHRKLCAEGRIVADRVHRRHRVGELDARYPPRLDQV